MADRLSQFTWLDKPGENARWLGEIFCVSFFRGLSPVEVLDRFGPEGTTGIGREMTIHDLGEVVGDFVRKTQGGSGGGYVGVRQVDGWSMAIELLGWYAVRPDYLTRLSRGCEMVAVSRHAYADDSFVYAVDGELITGFDPHLPGSRWGSEPDRINPDLHKLGLPTEILHDEAWEKSWHRLYDQRILRAFALAAEITGVVFTSSLLDGPLLVGPITQQA
ncbi:DUF6461 domain-containing protein [Actinomadura livida]|uniref:Uncharacterized protein n=1 Tax=Actinomadura livida TaxID=79909 RepID=A0A7W7IJZ8_9ACTN|nr:MULTISPECIES: DUF6461 domain-containing protein [Actinomadura]MBB4778482.1 hypothetical protein [Actinomadura catellatispora]GGU24222.1 hypothetical protein GCM10010208_56320 [Actinomadura livida]